MTDVFEALSQDHRDAARLFDRYAATGEDSDAREICDALTMHAEVEEQVLYPELRRIVDDGDDLANDAEAEHATMKLIIARIFESPPPDLRPVIDELRETVEHHVSNEERNLFPRLMDAGADREALGQKLEAVRGESPSRSSGTVG
jgi:hemerythrin superfamily protein